MFLDVYGECRELVWRKRCYASDEAPNICELNCACEASAICKPVGMAHHFYLYKLNHT